MSDRDPRRLLPAVTALVVLVVLRGGAVGQPNLPTPSSGLDRARFLEHVRFLSSDDLAGRANGSVGLERAAEYIAQALKDAGLDAGGQDGYFQPFDVGVGLRIEQGNNLTIDGAEGRYPLVLGQDYFPLSITSLPNVPDTQTSSLDDLPLIFAGYGISAPEHGHDDYAGVDVQGLPLWSLHTNPANGVHRTGSWDRHKTPRRLSARRLPKRGGAALLLVVEDPSHGPESTKYDRFVGSPQAEDLGIPVLRVRRDVVTDTLPALDLEGAFDALEQTGAGTPGVFLRLEGVRVTFAERYTRVRTQVRNVIGILHGTDPTHAHEAIVLGAHYDHLGIGGRYSLATSAAGEVHNGADDNASGTAALLELARTTAARPHGFPRTLIFAAFSGEELGLLGSSFYTTRPTVALTQTVAMINLDMIGRAHGRVLISGLARVPELAADVTAAAESLPLRVELFSEGPGDGASDDSSFIAHRIPAIGFFSGFHDDYHRPSDDWERIDVDGSLHIAALVLELTQRIAERSDQPDFK